jgi:hypothetical protein
MKALVLLSAILSACSGGTRTPARPAAPAPTIPADYAAGRDRLLRLGRAVAAELAARDAAGVFARFDEAMAKALPQDQLAATLAVYEVGALLGDDVYLAGETQVYFADVAWGTNVLALIVQFDAKDRIPGMLLSPRVTLPPDPRAGKPSKVELDLPFRGDWYVFWGGTIERQNYHVIAPGQRHAYDLVIWKDGGTAREGWKKPEDFHCWDAPIHAPAAGKVVAAVDGIEDNVPPNMNPAQPAGNHLVIEIAPDEYLFLAHLQRGTVKPKVGDAVARGELVGRCGNSGNSSEPHLHLHLQDKPDLLDPKAVGIPAIFAEYWQDGAWIERGAPVRGQFLRSGLSSVESGAGSAGK